MKGLIVGIKGTVLTNDEIAHLLNIKPHGFILFKRNIESKKQIIKLTNSLQNLFPDRDLKIPILIDQEGGRVQRIKQPIAEKNYPSAGYFREYAEKEGLKKALDLAYLNYFELASELKSLGINVNTVPCADLLYIEADSIIGDRSFGNDIANVIEFCKIVIKAHKDVGVETVIKHIPGHGRAKVDSHFDLPYIDNSIEELLNTDFKVFQELAPYCKYAMTAHIVFKDIDPFYPITLSPKGINFIRDVIGFKGEIITDAIEMKALKGSVAENSKLALEAGCNFVLHCDADISQIHVFES